MHITTSGTTTTQAQAYAGTSLAELKADALLRNAERLVKRVAPLVEGVEPSSAYLNAASDAELVAFEVFAVDPGYVRWKSAGDVSVRYRNEKADAESKVLEIMEAWVSTRKRYIKSLRVDRG